VAADHGRSATSPGDPRWAGARAGSSLNKTVLRGTEALTLEVGASISSSFARGVVPERFEVEPRASLLLFKMSELAATFFPFVKLDYAEALWRIAIRHEGEPAWFAIKCDLDHPVVRALGARLVRYP